MKRRESGRQSLLAASIVAAAAIAAGAGSQAAAQTTEYYFAYGADSTGGAVVDKSGNGHDLAAFFNGSFHYAPLTGGVVPVVGTAQAFDVAANIDAGDNLKKGGLTDKNPISDADFVSAGGYTFETWIKRNANDGLDQHIWNPEGTHSIEILGNANPANQQLQFAIRGLAAWTLPVQTVLPAGEWHHIMAVMTVPSPPSPVATYQFYVDGAQVGPTLGPTDLSTSFTSLTIRDERHGIGWNDFGGAGNGLNGSLAYTRLSLGVVSYQNSLAFAANIPVPEPSSLALAAFGLLAMRFRRSVAA